jgi:glucose-6-phosphate 1-dehydrogenase
VTLPCDMLVFGGTGDLALHKLLPALYHLHREGRLHPQLRIISLARQDHSREEYQAIVERNCKAQIARADFDREAWSGFAARLDYIGLDASHSSEFTRLATRLGDPQRARVYYLATAPALFTSIAKNLAIAGLAGPNTRIVLEKPSTGCSASTITWARRRYRT